MDDFPSVSDQHDPAALNARADAILAEVDALTAELRRSRSAFQGQQDNLTNLQRAQSEAQLQRRRRELRGQVRRLRAAAASEKETSRADDLRFDAASPAELAAALEVVHSVAIFVGTALASEVVVEGGKSLISRVMRRRPTARRLLSDLEVASAARWAINQSLDDVLPAELEPSKISKDLNFWYAIFEFRDRRYTAWKTDIYSRRAEVSIEVELISPVS